MSDPVVEVIWVITAVCGNLGDGAMCRVTPMPPPVAYSTEDACRHDLRIDMVLYPQDGPVEMFCSPRVLPTLPNKGINPPNNQGPITPCEREKETSPEDWTCAVGAAP